ncbi:MAG: hypothetical protein JAY97_08810 [Candidatus Thiodiazotropha sp. 'RUGA']|nr:hypothetical protein [Candidatus Thiodiazotropha sp. 'RUGA']
MTNKRSDGKPKKELPSEKVHSETSLYKTEEYYNQYAPDLDPFTDQQVEEILRRRAERKAKESEGRSTEQVDPKGPSPGTEE